MPYYEQMMPPPNEPMPRGMGDYGPPDDDRDDPRDYTHAERSRLAERGYEYNGTDGLWTRDVSCAVRTARRDHNDGKVLSGDVYIETVVRIIEDKSGESYHSRYREVRHYANGDTPTERLHRRLRADGCTITPCWGGFQYHYPTQTEG